jgi:hypothetical protein
MRGFRIAFASLLVVVLPLPAAALFHFSVIDEVMTSYDGDPNVQFVEIRMLAGSQNRVAHTVLARFDADGNYNGDLLVLTADVANQGADVRWLIGTPAFETVSGIQVDFEFAPQLLQASGMVCWGAPVGILPPTDPDSWDHGIPTNYIDCVAYGSYLGTNPLGGDPTPEDADGHSLVRVSDTDDNATDFTCGDPASPTNNAGDSASLAATIPCPEPAAPLLLATGALALSLSGRLRRRPTRAEGP